MTTKEQEEKLRQEWRTPPDLIAAVQSEFRFDLDVAASVDNAVTRYYLDESYDGLARPWFGTVAARVRPEHREDEGANEEGLTPLVARTVWCNPGFSKIERWIDKAIAEVGREPYSTAVMLGLCPSRLCGGGRRARLAPRSGCCRHGCSSWRPPASSRRPTLARTPCSSSGR